VDDDLEVSAGERARRVADVLGVADEVDVRVVGERLADLVEALTGPREVDAGLVLLLLIGHRIPLPASCWY
jgi:hypothetical protein